MLMGLGLMFCLLRNVHARPLLAASEHLKGLLEIGCGPLELGWTGSVELKHLEMAGDDQARSDFLGEQGGFRTI